MLPFLILLLIDAVLVVSANKKCFDDKDELQSAIRSYIDGNCGKSFSNCEVSETYGSPMNSWCVGNVTDMSRLFFGEATFNEDISGWDTSSVINMRGMFYYATSFNGDLSNWDTSSVESMDYMFEGAASFNQDLCAWRDNFPYGQAGIIFIGSNCTFQDTPQLGQQGPFCASSCTKSPTSAACQSYTSIYSAMATLIIMGLFL